MRRCIGVGTSASVLALERGRRWRRTYRAGPAVHVTAQEAHPAHRKIAKSPGLEDGYGPGDGLKGNCAIWVVGGGGPMFGLSYGP